MVTTKRIQGIMTHSRAGATGGTGAGDAQDGIGIRAGQVCGLPSDSRGLQQGFFTLLRVERAEDLVGLLRVVVEQILGVLKIEIFLHHKS